MKRERSRKKLEKVLKQKGYPKGKLPRGKVAHHIKPVAEGGKTKKSNISVISATKHKKIHKNRRKRGKI
jgi:hypothetical protein